MNERVARLRRESYETPVSLSAERAELITDFYRENEGRHSVPVTRALALDHLCRHQTLHIGEDELIVGERGPAPKAVSTYPELTCHSLDDLAILDARPKTPYQVSDEVRKVYAEKIIPYWSGRSMREEIFERMSEKWRRAYAAGLFTEFMEQRAPGHTALDGKCYEAGLLDFIARIDAAASRLDAHDPAAAERREQYEAMRIACRAVIRFAERHAELAESLAASHPEDRRRDELLRIAAVCRRVPARAPRDLHEALQMYWFAHLGTIMELNGWDAMNPGHLDRHLLPFYERQLAEGSLDRERAKELIQCFWIKFNNHPAPPKVGVTAAESGTYNDFTNINIGGVLADGGDGVSELSYLLLEVMDEIHLLQPQGNIQLSRVNENRFLHAACAVIRKGYGYPSVFNADGLIEQQLRAGKSLADAREGGASGCVETGAFGKEAYILTGYFNSPKILELALNDGVDPVGGRRLGPATGDPRGFASFDELYAAFETQLAHCVGIKLAGNAVIERLFAERMPAVFLSVLIDDCIEKGVDYNAGGARYNTSYIQCVGIGSITDSLSAIRKHVFEERKFGMDELLSALAEDFAGAESLRRALAERTPRYGNDDDEADAIMQRVFASLLAAIDGRPNERGGAYHVDMLPTTSHIYFGSVMGASADGRRAGRPLSEGISPVQGADRKGPTAVLNSAGKMDQLATGGTLLNMKFPPRLLAERGGVEHLGHLIRGYFRQMGHHLQFNVVDAQTLRRAQERPEEHRDLIVRVAGYSDYFCDVSKELQDEIIARTTQETL